MSEVVIEAKKLSKIYKREEFEVRALDNCDIEINKGEFVALMGPSGSGKSTLMHLIAAMDRATSGKIAVLGEDLSAMSDAELARWRNRHIGFIFQQFNLIPVLTAVENVELPLKLTSLKSSERMRQAETALKLVGLEDRLTHFPRQLSGGQEQSVVIARAIATDPDILLADEPTGNLDSQSAKDVMSMLQKLNKDFGKTIILVTHDRHAAEYATMIRHLEKGELKPEIEYPAQG